MVKDYIIKYERVQAIQWTGLNASEVSEFIGQGLLEIKNVDYNVLIKIPTVEENHYARIGDWIMKNENSEYWVIDNEVFNEIYKEPEPCECEPVKADPKKELGRALANLQNIGTVQIPKLIEELSGEDEEMATAYVIKYMKFMQNIDNEEVSQKIIDDLMK